MNDSITPKPGRDQTHIMTLEFDGVALAAIQGLNRKIEEQGNQSQDLKLQTNGSRVACNASKPCSPPFKPARPAINAFLVAERGL